MTKEKIIDGIDVSDCMYYEPKAIKMNCHEQAISKPCNTSPICYYKLLHKAYKNCECLEQENERLKHKIETILKRKKDNCTCEDCYNEGLWEGMAIGSYEEVARLKHTLQEIKEIAEQILNKNEFVYMDYRDVRQIIRLITKAEEE